MAKLRDGKTMVIDGNNVVKVQHNALIEECDIRLNMLTVANVEHNFQKKLFDIEGLQVEENGESVIIGYIVYDEYEQQDFYLIDSFIMDF